jgi:hypothetical protein
MGNRLRMPGLETAMGEVVLLPVTDRNHRKWGGRKYAFCAQKSAVMSCSEALAQRPLSDPADIVAASDRFGFRIEICARV